MKKIDYADVTMVVSPVACRCGYRRLADIDFDVSLGEDCVVFVSKSRGICKIIHCDEYGRLIVRMLLRRRFERFLMEAEEPTGKPLSYAQGFCSNLAKKSRPLLSMQGRHIAQIASRDFARMG